MHNDIQDKNKAIALSNHLGPFDHMERYFSMIAQLCSETTYSLWKTMGESSQAREQRLVSGSTNALYTSFIW